MKNLILHFPFARSNFVFASVILLCVTASFHAVGTSPAFAKQKKEYQSIPGLEEEHAWEVELKKRFFNSPTFSLIDTKVTDYSKLRARFWFDEHGYIHDIKFEVTSCEVSPTAYESVKKRFLAGIKACEPFPYVLRSLRRETWCWFDWIPRLDLPDKPAQISFGSRHIFSNDQERDSLEEQIKDRFIKIGALPKIDSNLSWYSLRSSFLCDPAGLCRDVRFYFKAKPFPVAMVPKISDPFAKAIRSIQPIPPMTKIIRKKTCCCMTFIPSPIGPNPDELKVWSFSRIPCTVDDI